MGIRAFRWPIQGPARSLAQIRGFSSAVQHRRLPISEAGAAVMATVLRKVCSEMASTNFNNALAWRGKWIDLLTCANTVDAGMSTWSRVLQHFTRSPTGCVSERDSWRDFSSSSSSSTYNESCYLVHGNSIGWMNEDTLCFGGVGLMLSMWEDMGRILSWSSITTQWWQLERDSRNLHRERQREVHTCTTKKIKY